MNIAFVVVGSMLIGGGLTGLAMWLILAWDHLK